MTRHRRALARQALCLVALCAAPAGAQTASDWSRTCDDSRCTVAARLAAEGRDTLFATIVIGFGRDGAAPSIMLGVPLGIAVQPGVRLVIDADTAIDVPVTVCLPDGCNAARALSADEARALAAADRLEVRYFGFSAESPLAASVSVRGLGEALAELR